MKRQLIIGGRLVDIPDQGGMKAITSIPGWAETFNEENAQGGTQGGLAALVAQSVWATRCITLRANALAAIPWRLVKYIQGANGEEEQEQDESHPLAELLREVGQGSNWADLMRATEWDLCVHGTAYWLKVLSKRGKEIVSLRRLNPVTMSVKKEPDGIAGFEQSIKGHKTPFETEEIVYFHEFHPLDDLGGLSMVSVSRPSIEVEINCDKYLAAFFQNYAVPATYVTTSAQLTEPDWQRAQSRWKRAVGGVTKAFKTIFLDQGLEPKTLGVAPKDQELSVVRQEARRAICAAFGIPPAIAGAWEAANYAASQEQRMSLYQDTEIPRAEYIADVINEELVPYFDPSLKFEFVYDELDVMQEDLAAKAERISKLVQAGVITPSAGARDMGYAEEDFGSGQPTPPMPAPFRAQIEGSDLQAELRRWRRKALRALKATGSAVCGFESQILGGAMKAAILEQLGSAQTPEDIHAIFLVPLTSEPKEAKPISVQPATDPSLVVLFSQALKALADRGDVQIDTGPIAGAIAAIDKRPIELTAKIDSPVTVHVPTPDVLVVNDVQPAKVEPAIEVRAAAAPALVTVVNQPPKLRRRREKQKVQRDRAGAIDGSETAVEYEYEE